MKKLILILSLLISSPLYAAIEFKDEGTSQGYINVIDCVGAGVACTKSGITGTATIGGASLSIGSAVSGGGASRVLFEDTSQNLAADANFTYTATASAVNGVGLASSITGANPTFTASGSDTNVGINLTTKGTGALVVTTSATATQSTITSGLVVNNASAGNAADDFTANGDTVSGLLTVDASADNVGIGTAAPATRFDILGADNSTVQTIRINATQANVTAADVFMDFRSTTGSEGTIAGTAVAGVIAYNTFTGSHYTLIEDRTGLVPLMVLETTGEKIGEFPKDKTRDVVTETKTGEKVLDVETGLQVDEVITSTKQEAYSDASPKEQLVKARICKTRASKTAMGVYGGTDPAGRDMVLSIGTGLLIVANKGKDIEAGDYLISSDVAGRAEAQDDDLYHNYTLAKAEENIVWNIGETERTIAVIYLGG